MLIPTSRTTCSYYGIRFHLNVKVHNLRADDVTAPDVFSRTRCGSRSDPLAPSETNSREGRFKPTLGVRVSLTSERRGLRDDAERTRPCSG